MNKSGISAIYYATGKQVDTSSIRGMNTFPVIKPDQPTKLLGVCMSLTGNFRAEKQHVMEETSHRVEAMAQNQILTLSLTRLRLELQIPSLNVRFKRSDV